MKVESHLLLSQSLHPKMVTTWNAADLQSPGEDCRLDLVYELPASVFVDPYQLQDVGLNATVLGEHDLELPLEKVRETRGSLVLIRQVVSPVTLPFHTRYQRPQSYPYQAIRLSPPYAGWSCGRAPWPVLKHPLIRPTTGSYPAFAPLLATQDPWLLYVPVGRQTDRSFVTFGTFAIILACTAWVAGSLFSAVQKRKRSDAKGKRRKSD
ncbi:PIG-X [Sporodiniella umbellata]|nr:PIG-X [Sporodiniella umbellata]